MIGPRCIATIEPLIEALEAVGAEPTIARNYEQFPRFSHDLDLFIRGSGAAVAPAFEAVAKQLDWDFLTICTHYATHDRQSLNIFAYRFHRLDPPETLLVDLFGGVWLLGVCLTGADRICARRIRHPSERFHHIDPLMENGYRLFQLAALVRVKSADWTKIERYRQKVLDFDAANNGALNGWAEHLGIPAIGRSLGALRDSDHPRYVRTMRRARLGYCARRAMDDPRATASSIADRCVGLLRERLLAPCGPSLVLSSARRAEWEEVLDKLVKTHYLPSWTPTVRRPRQSGVAQVRFTKAGEPFRNTEASFASLALQIIHRHQVLYRRETAS